MPQLLIDVTNPQAVRITAAFGRAYGLVDESGQPRAATNAEVRQRLITFIREIVATQERSAAIAAIMPVEMDIP